MKVQGLNPADLKNQVLPISQFLKLDERPRRLWWLGAGSAGGGVMLTVRNVIIRRHGLTKKKANKRFYIIDQDRLITKEWKNLADM